MTTHATGARAHTPRERAHSTAGCRLRARATRQKQEPASALGAHLDLRPGSALGARLPGAQALGTRAALCAALASPERTILPGKGSVGAGDLEGEKSAAR